jgi:cleavage and polyadenylation specificity factor subunit 2
LPSEFSLLTTSVSVAPTIDYVLISHADMQHMGALPYAMAKLGMQNAIVCGTIPVYNMGNQCMLSSTFCC